MGSNVPLFPEAASEAAARVDSLFLFWLVVSIFATVLIYALVLVLAVKYRRRPGNLEGVPIHGSTALEVGWSVVPLLVCVVLFAWGAEVYFHLYRPPQDTMKVNVVGKRWMWKIQHAGGRREINELHVPLGRAVKLNMTSEDVIHSFFVPAFRVKQDVLPGRYTSLWFRAVKPGRFHLFCAEYCGTDHSGMGGWVTVMDPSAFQAWLADEGGAAAAPKVSPAAAGAELFTKLACATCHKKIQPGEPPSLGPALDGVFGSAVKLQGGATVTADEAYLRQSILEPMAAIVEGFPPVMPTFKGQVDEDQVLALIAYIQSLAKASAGAPASGGNS